MLLSTNRNISFDYHHKMINRECHFHVNTQSILSESESQKKTLRFLFKIISFSAAMRNGGEAYGSH